MKTTDPKSEWNRARNLLKGTRGHTRLRHAGNILLGKTLSETKKKIGLGGRGGDRRSKVQLEPLIGSGLKRGHMEPSKTQNEVWDALCKEELGISRITANRYIGRFEKALECSKNVHPEIHHLLSVPSAELDGSELEKLAAKVEELVDLMTRSNLMIELGLTIEKSDETEKEECDYNHPSKFQEALALEATTLFSSVPRRIKNLKAAIHGVRDHSRYALLLRELDLDSSTPGAPTLAGIKEALEEMLEGDLAAVLKDVTDAYDAKLAVLNGEQPKKRRKNSKLANR